MRIDVKKYLFVGPEKERALFFAQAQKAGFIHFIDSNPKQSKAVPDAVTSFTRAIKILRGLPVLEQMETEEYWKAPQTAEDINSLHDRLEVLAEEKRTLGLEMHRVAVFGDFSIEDIAAIEQQGNRKVQFFCAKAHALDSLESCDHLIPIGAEHGLHYFMAVNPKARQYPNMIEVKIDRPLGELRKRLQEVEKETRLAEHKLKAYAHYNLFLRHALISVLNQHNYEVASKYPQSPMDGRLFAVMGWVPVNKIEQLRALASRLDIYVDEIAIEAHDAIPTYLENEGWSRVGEDLVRIYDLPSHQDKDPSTWVLAFFAVFFAMIVGDAGYGLLYLALALFLRYKFPKPTKAGKRFINLVFLLAGSCIVWGILASSFFSLPIDLNSPLRRVSLITWLADKKAEYVLKSKDSTYEEWLKTYPKIADAKTGHEVIVNAAVQKDGFTSYPLLAKLSDGILVDFILALGIFHLIISLVRNMRSNWPAIGWVIFLVGAYLYFPKFLHATTMSQYLLGISPERAESAGLHLVYLGLGTAAVLGIVQNRWFGLIEITNVIQVCGDVLSYLRLYALGLAGAMVAGTINDLAAPMPFVFAVIVLAFGHALNMVLGIMSGVIHGLRLNFLEWFHYSFQGDGRPFSPLQKIDVE